MWRAGFGTAAAQLNEISTITPKKLYGALKKASENKPVFINSADDYLRGLMMGLTEAKDIQKKKDLDPEERKLLQQKQRESIKTLNLAWLDQMVNSEAQLREKMAFFWHGHFASRNINVFYQQDLLDIIRQNALGNFRDLLHEVSRSAAMINFLNANQNRKDHPNENFAREVMELFTMGRGNYTENDVKEAARAFTGWGANIKGEFVFRRFQHDDGDKTILGRTGNFDGDNVLDILLEQKQTAKFITQKIYRFFVNDTIDKEKLSWLSERFYQSGYNISALMDDIFTSDWFYDASNIGVRIKSPIELIVGIRRMLPMQLEKPESQLLIERVLGQILFYPPNVAGWPGGKTWIDSSTLMMRMRLPQMINDTDTFNIKPKTDDDQMMGRMEENTPIKKAALKNPEAKPISAIIDWNSYLKYFTAVPKEKIIESLTGCLLQVKPQYEAGIITNYTDNSSREAFVKTATIQIMSTPEYQLC